MNSTLQKRYSFLLIMQHLLLLFDICINAFSTFAREKPGELLVLFVVQDFFLIVSFTIFLANIFSTQLFQAGLIQLLFLQFRLTLIICVLYIILSICLHSWYMSVHYTAPLTYFWPIGYHLLYSVQRTIAVIYYYLSKRASFKVVDPYFNNVARWRRRQFNLA